MLVQRKKAIGTLALLDPEIPGAKELPSGEWAINRAAALLNFPTLGLKVHIPVWANKSLADKVELLLNNVPVDQQIVTQPAELTQRATLFVAPGRFQTGAWKLAYRVTRFNQAPEPFVPPLELAVKLEIPAGQDTDPGQGHSNLHMAFRPPEIVQDGVDKDTAEKGVDILVIAKPGSGSDLPYPDIAVGDVIIASWGGKLVESNPVTQAQIDDPLNNPIIIHISKAVILAAGDSGSDKLAVSFLVRDFADNDSEDWCKEARIRVDTGNSRLDAPILKQADGNELDLDQLGNQQLVLQVFAASSVDFNLGDIIIMHLQGTTLDGEPVEVEVRQRIDKNPPLVVDVLMDNDGARALAKTQGVFFFDLERGGSIIQRSRGRFINMKGEPKRLAAPIIESAVGGALDPDLANVIVRFPYDPLITPDNAIELIWSITLADGTAFEPELDWIFPTEDEADDPKGFITIISGPKYLKPGEGGTLVVSYNLLSEAQNGEIVRRPSTPAAQLNIGEPRFELVPPILLGEKDGALEPKDLPNGISEVNCPNPVNNPTKAKDVVYWQLLDASGKVLVEDYKELSTLSAGKDVKFSLNAAFVQQYFEAHRGERLSVRYHIERFDTGKISYSNPLEFRVGAALELPAPDIKEAPNGISLDPLAAKDSLTAIINYPMQAGDKLTVTWTGAPGTPAEGSHTTALINAGTQPQPIPLPNSVVAFNLNKTVTVTYTVTRGGVALPTSPALTLSVLALPVSALPKPRILQAADAGNGIELNVANLTGNATLRFDPWGLIAIRQSVFLSLNGTYADGRAYNFVIWQSNSGAFVDQNWVTNGYQHGVANTELKKLREGSALNIVFKVGFGKSTNEAEAVTFPLRTYTVRTVALVAPVISGVKDASGWDIPDNGYSVRNNVTVNGTAPAGQQVEIFDGAESKGKVTATGGTWLIPLNGLALNVLHSIKAVGQYGSNPASNVWRFTSVPEINASIDLIKETDTDKIIDQNGWTTRNAITVEGTANAYLKVQLYDNNVPISGAIATAGTNNKWTYQLTNLLDGAHTIKAKALYGGGSEASRMLNISKAASGLEDLTRDPSTTFPTNVEKRLTSGLVVKYISGDGRIGPYEGFPVMWCSNTQTHIQFDFAGGTEVKGISLGIFVQPDGWADGTISGTMNIYGKSGQLIASKHYSLVDELANNHHMFFRSETYFSRVTLTINPPSALVNFGITHFHWS